MDDDDDVPLNSHALAIGGTRPALVPGLNMPAADVCFFIMAAGEAAVWRMTLLIPVGIAFIASLRLYRRDYNAGRCMLCWLETSGRQLSDDGNYIDPRIGRGFYGVLKDI